MVTCLFGLSPIMTWIKVSKSSLESKCFGWKSHVRLLLFIRKRILSLT